MEKLIVFSFKHAIFNRDAEIFAPTSTFHEPVSGLNATTVTYVLETGTNDVYWVQMTPLTSLVIFSRIFSTIRMGL